VLVCAREAQQEQQAAKEGERIRGAGPGAVGGKEDAAHPADVNRNRAPKQAVTIGRRDASPGCRPTRTLRKAVIPHLPRRLGDALLLVAAIAAAAIAALVAGQDANWDLRNYHLYNPWAWLNGRYGFDLAPAQRQTFHNPLLDVPFYAMVAADWNPRLISTVLAVPAGVALYFVVKLARLLIAHADRTARAVAIAGAAAIGVTGANGLALVGTTMNEWPVAALVTVSTWLIVRDLASGDPRFRTLLLAGALMGCASGLKLPASTFAIGTAIALLARRDPVGATRDALVFGIAVLAGVALALGPWMAFLYEHYQNPLFPYFNNVFESPLAAAESFRDPRFGPRSALQWLTFPFELLEPPAGYVGELRYRDARFPALAALTLVGVIAHLARLARRHVPAAAGGETDRSHRFFAIYVAVSFVLWAMLHSIYRYLLPLELLTGIAIVLLLGTMLPRAIAACAVLAAVLVVATTDAPSWGRVEFGSRFLEVSVPEVERNALVVLTVDEPMAYALTAFPADARHVGIENNLVHAGVPSGMRERAAAIVAGHPGPIYELTILGHSTDVVLDAYGLRRTPDGCVEVRSNLVQMTRLWLCRVQRLGG
jgi:hypothetical protein